MRHLSLAELFCGAGGIGQGAKQTGKYSHVFASDLNEDAMATYAYNLRPDEFFIGDVRDIDFPALRKKIGRPDLLSFGFPCNDFSAVGERLGTKGKYGSLYQSCLSAVQELQPKAFLAENVKGLLSSDRGRLFPKILSEFEGLGYRVFWKLVKFEELGVPQNRHRVIIIGIKNSCHITFHFPAKKAVPVSAAEAIEGTEGLPNSEIRWPGETVQKRLSYIKEGKGVFSSSLPESLTINTNTRISSIYRRISRFSPSHTLTAAGGGGTEVYHWKENRALTNRELARLQAFPDSFIFKGKRQSVRKQIGMAVPPKGIQPILLRIAAVLQVMEIKENHNGRQKGY